MNYEEIINNTIIKTYKETHPVPTQIMCSYEFQYTSFTRKLEGQKNHWTWNIGSEEH
jgi:hypothetical protein